MNNDTQFEFTILNKFLSKKWEPGQPIPENMNFYKMPVNLLQTKYGSTFGAREVLVLHAIMTTLVHNCVLTVSLGCTKRVLKGLIRTNKVQDVFQKFVQLGILREIELSHPSIQSIHPSIEQEHLVTNIYINKHVNNENKEQATTHIPIKKRRKASKGKVVTEPKYKTWEEVKPEVMAKASEAHGYSSKFMEITWQAMLAYYETHPVKNRKSAAINWFNNHIQIEKWEKFKKTQVESDFDIARRAGINFEWCLWDDGKGNRIPCPEEYRNGK